MNDIVISSNIPVPGVAKYPLDAMQVGDSFPVVGVNVNSFRVMVSKYGASHSKKFTVRKHEGGYRCWRTE